MRIELCVWVQLKCGRWGERPVCCRKRGLPRQGPRSEMLSWVRKGRLRDGGSPTPAPLPPTGPRPLLTAEKVLEGGLRLPRGGAAWGSPSERAGSGRSVRAAGRPPCRAVALAAGRVPCGGRETSGTWRVWRGGGGGRLALRGLDLEELWVSLSTYPCHLPPRWLLRN